MRKLLAVLIVPLLIVGCAATPGETPGMPSAPSQTSVPTEPATSVTIGMSYIPNIQFAPFYVAQTKGYFDSVGVPVELRHHGAQEGLFTAIGTGQEQFVIAGGDEALLAREQGVNLVAVGGYYQQYPVRIIAPTANGINTLDDLRGKRIGIPGRYGENWFSLLVALNAAGLQETDVDIMEIGYTYAAALSTDKVDAVVGFVNNDFVQFQLAGMDVVALPLTREGNPPLVGASILTTEEFLAENPELTRKVVTAIVDGIEDAFTNPNAAVEISAAFVPTLSAPEAARAAKATLAATLEIMARSGSCEMTPDPCPVDDECTSVCTSIVRMFGMLDIAEWREMASFLLSVKVLTQEVDVNKAMTNVLG
ncbi:MAG: ABC transporter substrate-binding protein [Propionibacteriaceae bacterium]|nr:ABC transporter substrate-binding protein [Propionibacteriaceae bacterium]